MSIRHTFTMLDVSDVSAAADVEDEPTRRVDTAMLEDFVFELRGTINAGTSADVKVQDSFDEGATWNDAIVFTQLVGDGAQVIDPKTQAGVAAGLGPLLRVVRTTVGDGWDLRLKAAANPKR